ncbi:MAG: Methionine aminopeptidase, partial [uncultured Solirubrobacteraceae bacterium]
DHPQVPGGDRADGGRGRHPHPDDEAPGGEDPRGGHHRRARRGRREVHPLPGRRAGVQGLPRLHGLHLRLAQLDGGPRDPRALRALARGHHLHRHRRDPRGLGRRRRRDVPRRPGHPDRPQAPRGHPAVALRGGGPVPGRPPPGRRLARGADRGGGRGAERRALPRRPRHRPGHARGPPDPQLRRAGPRPAPGGGDGPRRGAHGQRGAPRGPDGRRRVGDLLPGRLAGRPLRVHHRRHGGRAADPHAVARGALAARRRHRGGV